MRPLGSVCICISRIIIAAARRASVFIFISHSQRLVTE